MLRRDARCRNAAGEAAVGDLWWSLTVRVMVIQRPQLCSPGSNYYPEPCRTDMVVTMSLLQHFRGCGLFLIDYCSTTLPVHYYTGSLLSETEVIFHLTPCSLVLRESPSPRQTHLPYRVHRFHHFTPCTPSIPMSMQSEQKQERIEYRD